MADKRRKTPLEDHGPFLVIPSDSAVIAPAVLQAFPEHAKYIGSIIAEWSHIEYKLMLYLALNLTAEAYIIEPMIYAIESSRARLRAIESALLRLADNEKAERFIVRLMDRANRLLTKRNAYAHGLFSTSRGDDLYIIGISGRKTVPVPLYGLKHQFEAIRAFSYRLTVLLAPMLGVQQEVPVAPGTVPPHLVSLRFARRRRVPRERQPPSPE